VWINFASSNSVEGNNSRGITKKLVALKILAISRITELDEYGSRRNIIKYCHIFKCLAKNQQTLEFPFLPFLNLTGCMVSKKTTHADVLLNHCSQKYSRLTRRIL
jgi:hypothetical protein